VEIGPLEIFEGPQLLTLGLQAAPALSPRSPALTSYAGQIIINALPIPEPETWLLMIAGLLVLRARARRHQLSALH